MLWVSIYNFLYLHTLLIPRQRNTVIKCGPCQDAGEPCTIAAGEKGCLQCARCKKKPCAVRPAAGWSDIDITQELAEDDKAGVIAALNKRGFCTGEDDAELLEELQRLPRELCDAWEIFSGEELFDFLGELVEPRLALDEPVEVDEEDSTNERVRQAIAESRRDTEQQAQLVGQAGPERRWRCLETAWCA